MKIEKQHKKKRSMFGKTRFLVGQCLAYNKEEEFDLGRNKRAYLETGGIEESIGKNKHFVVEKKKAIK